MATITDLGFTWEDLRDSHRAGDVRMQVHPEFERLTIWNYTEETQYRNKWNKVTLACRGLILDHLTGEVVARPWEKFFNFGQMDNRIESNAPVEVSDKMDGSLGILYEHPKYNYAIATRGSFASEQALEGTAMLHGMYRQDFANFEVAVDNFTFLFEIIYPQNRIVVNYGDQRDLVLLGAVNKRHGYYLGPQEAQGTLLWTGPVTEVWHYDRFVDALSAPDRKGKEGYVIRSGTNIVKLKQADYVELHRIVTNLSPKTVWEMLGAGKTAADICADIPDEFHKYVEDIEESLNQQASDIYNEVNLAFIDILLDTGCTYDATPAMSRRKFAEHAKKKGDLAKYLFLMLDKRDVRAEIWKHIKPRGDVKSLVKDEG